MTNISIPNFVAMEQIYKCYNALETQFVCLFDTMKPIMLTLQWIPPNNQNKKLSFLFSNDWDGHAFKCRCFKKNTPL